MITMNTYTNSEIEEVFGKALSILPGSLSSTQNLTEQFQIMLGSGEAMQAKSVVYCYLSELPLQTKNSQTNIVYLGKTKGSIKGRYYQYARKLATGKNGEFYGEMIERYGGINMGYIISDAPRHEERACFARYRQLHGQMPPKSKRG